MKNAGFDLDAKKYPLAREVIGDFYRSTVAVLCWYRCLHIRRYSIDAAAVYCSTYDLDNSVYATLQ